MMEVIFYSWSRELKHTLYLCVAGESLHQHPPLPHRVLPPAGRDHPAHLPGRAFIRKTSSIHHDPRYLQVEAGWLMEDNDQLMFQYMCHNCCPQYSFSLSSDAHNGSLDQANILMNNKATNNTQK